MIGQFPKFTALRLEDKKEYQKIISSFAPYSDFNFVSLFSWNINDKTFVSKLGSGIVIRL